ncbi:MAG: hypothetical protein IJ368_06215 [Oscillospiraceae bacterium]|nr:hypothetical protein [Oscillospiraceae bacterium]
MKLRIGIDMGGSGVKIIILSDKLETIAKTKYPSDGSAVTLEDELCKLMKAAGISSDDIVYACVTGAGAAVVNESIAGIAVKKFGEFESFGRGSRYLSNLDNILAVSMGTGTAFVRCDGSRYTHLGGSGVGGGTLAGLSSLLIDENDTDAVNSLISKGNYTNVDLTVGDICEGGCGGLSPDVTAANFGKKHMSDRHEDIAAALANMIFQTAGVMAAFACKGTDIDKAVFVGSMTDIPEGREMLRAVGKLHGMEFIVPDNGAFAGAIGAVLRGTEEE